MTSAQTIDTSPSQAPDLTDAEWARLLEIRASDPGAVARAYAVRKRPGRLLNDDGTIFLVAADHPARGALASGPDPMAMADRRSLLARLVEALRNPAVDGVLGTPDVVEELLLLGVLEDKVVIGSMNRGGLDGASWTMDDRFTGYDAASIARFGLEGGKMLLRIDDQDPSTAPTIENCAVAVSELAELGLMAMVEPLPYHREVDGSLTLRKDAPSLARAITIASGLGTTSAYTWLKMPSCDDPDHGVRRHDPAVRGARRGARPRPGRGPGGLGSDALAAGRARPRGRPLAALPAGRRRARGRRGGRHRAPGGQRVHPMSRHRPAGTAAGAEGRVVALTPDDAGWDWTGICVLEIPAGTSTTIRTGGCEAFVLPLAGSLGAAVSTEDDEPLASYDLTGRDSVFSAVTDFAYVGRDSVVVLTATGPRASEVALPSSRCTQVLPPAYGPAEQVPVEVRGAGNATRQVTNFGVPGVWDHAEKLVCCELITPPGNWSTYPPHKHDASEPCEVVNEEIYYYRIAGADQVTPSSVGFGYHHTYTGPEHEKAGLEAISTRSSRCATTTRCWCRTATTDRASRPPAIRCTTST